MSLGVANSGSSKIEKKFENLFDESHDLIGCLVFARAASKNGSARGSKSICFQSCRWQKQNHARQRQRLIKSATRSCSYISVVTRQRLCERARPSHDKSSVVNKGRKCSKWTNAIASACGSCDSSSCSTSIPSSHVIDSDTSCSNPSGSSSSSGLHNASSSSSGLHNAFVSTGRRCLR
jgi:hypothetical protein